MEKRLSNTLPGRKCLYMWARIGPANWCLDSMLERLGKGNEVWSFFHSFPKT
jgi:hypothetical protein